MRSLNFCMGMMLQSASQRRVRALPWVNSCFSICAYICRQDALWIHPAHARTPRADEQT